MGFFDDYPYTNWHNVNLDWVLERVKEWGQMVEANNQAFQDLEEANASFKEYVTNYLQELDIQAQIDDKLDRMFESGELTDYLQPYVSNTVTDWLDEHITEPVGVVIDTSLTVAGAAADAKATGDKIELLTEAVRTGSITELARTLILNCFNNVVWANRAGQDYYESLRHEIYGSELIISYTQPHIFDFGTSLAELRNNLSVSYVNSQGQIVETNDYTLNGEINNERSAITVIYGNRTGTFNVLAAPANRWINNVLTISNSEIVQGSFDGNPSTNYHNSGNTRILYIGVKCDFDSRYKYTINVTTNASINVACRGLLLESLYNFANYKGVRTSDSGWQSNNYTINSDGSIADLGCIFVPIRKTSNANIVPTDISNIKITRVMR